jgi:hypothetical protein
MTEFAHLLVLISIEKPPIRFSNHFKNFRRKIAQKFVFILTKTPFLEKKTNSLANFANKPSQKKIGKFSQKFGAFLYNP